LDSQREWRRRILGALGIVPGGVSMSGWGECWVEVKRHKEDERKRMKVSRRGEARRRIIEVPNLK